MAAAEIAFRVLRSRNAPHYSHPAQEQLLEMAAVAARSFQKQMGPKDALESLAHTLVLMAHGRVAWLTKLATSQHLANPAVDEEHRPQKPGRKGANQHERPKTRRTVRRQRRAPETDEGDTKGAGAND